MGPEARGRLAAEAELLRVRRTEFERLLKRHDRHTAIVTLIEKHKNEYGDLVKAHRERFEAKEPAR